MKYLEAGHRPRPITADGGWMDGFLLVAGDGPASDVPRREALTVAPSGFPFTTTSGGAVCIAFFVCAFAVSKSLLVCSEAYQVCSVPTRCPKEQESYEKLCAFAMKELGRPQEIYLEHTEFSLETIPLFQLYIGSALAVAHNYYNGWR